MTMTPGQPKNPAKKAESGRIGIEIPNGIPIRLIAMSKMRPMMPDTRSFLIHLTESEKITPISQSRKRPTRPQIIEYPPHPIVTEKKLHGKDRINDKMGSK